MEKGRNKDVQLYPWEDYDHMVFVSICIVMIDNNNNKFSPQNRTVYTYGFSGHNFVRDWCLSKHNEACASDHQVPTSQKCKLNK